MADKALGRVVREARDRLRAAGIDGAERDAGLLVASVVDLPAQRLVLCADRAVGDGEQHLIASLLDRRAGGEPVGRILGVREFWSLPFRLSAATLEPRPDTETLVEAALDWVDDRGLRAAPFRIADLGTGTGAVLVAVLAECPNAFGIGTDLSDDALRTARGNAERAGVGGRVGFARMSYADALSPEFDLVVSNPPYIPSADIETLAPEVRRHDPRLALDGGADGLDGYRMIAGSVPSLLRPDGAVMVEVGAGQAEPVGDLFRDAGMDMFAARRDLAGHLRVVAARHHRRLKTRRQNAEMKNSPWKSRTKRIGSPRRSTAWTSDATR